jgi:hypothetical protein
LEIDRLLIGFSDNRSRMSKSIVPPPAPRISPRLPTEIVSAARTAAAGTKTDFKSLLASSLSESRHDPHAHNKRSSAAGAFQFTERTWLDLVRRHGAALGQGDAAAKITVTNGKPGVADPADRASILALRTDSSFAGALAARYSDENRVALGKHLGRKVNENEVRIAYLLGASGAGRLLRAAHEHPRIGVDKIVPGAVRSNPGLFRRPNGTAKTAGEAVAALERHFDGEMRQIKNAVTRLSAAEPAIVPVDDDVA